MSTSRLKNAFKKRENVDSDVVPPLGETNLDGAYQFLYYDSDTANKKARESKEDIFADLCDLNVGDFETTKESLAAAPVVTQQQKSEAELREQKVASLLADIDRMHLMAESLAVRDHALLQRHEAEQKELNELIGHESPSMRKMF